jgi:IS30 family transposase
MEGMTITEMAKKLGLPQRTVERRIQRAGIKPMSREAVYPADTLEKISDVKMGRPPKVKPVNTDKNRK